MGAKQTLRDISIAGKTLLIRADFNVPIDNYGIVVDDYRIRRALPTIEHAIGSGAKVVLISHLGRPAGKKNNKYSLEPVAAKLRDLLHKDVAFVNDCIGPKAKDAIAALTPGDVLLLENLRFYPEEELNDDDFARQLSEGCDYFVQDGFGVVHRSHASTEAVTRFLPSVAGLLLASEVQTLTSLTSDPNRPFGVIIGGAKIADKLPLIDRFIDSADYIAVVGAVANTFLAAEDVAIGKSLVDLSCVNRAKDILKRARARMQRERFTFYIPHDVVVATSKDTIKPLRVVDIAQHTWADITAYPKKPKKHSYTIAKDEYILDIGPMTASAIAGAMSQLKMVLWNGTAGITEITGLNGAERPYAHGTRIITRGLVGAEAGAKNVPYSIIGGGDTVAYIESVPGLREQCNFVSTGGGSSLALLAGEPLPGLEALLDVN